VISRHHLVQWVEDALRKLGGSARIVDVAREISRAHANDLEGAGDLNFTWQYDMRWAALKLSKAGRVALSNKAGQGRWALIGEAAR
jgi:hypothetical protein